MKLILTSHNWSLIQGKPAKSEVVDGTNTGGENAMIQIMKLLLIPK